MATETLAPAFLIEDFLAQERSKDMLRFSTAGSVDDGKSTLIGRLLYDTQSVYEDQVRSIEGKGTTAPGQIDFALLTDGLRAEREQGITIDVAYRYFSTARRKFIIADTPGHEQYTRNMATGASTADAAVVLLDARKGVLSQSRRHAYIASLLGVRHILVAVNKMDLVDYDEDTFRTIELDFGEVLKQIAADTGSPVQPIFVPVSALAGDNVVHGSGAMPWYRGPSLLELLETLPASIDTRNAPLRFPVQRVLRPDQDFRGFAGQIASGTVRPGDTVTVLPSGRSAQVTRIVTYDGDLAEAYAPLSITLTLSHELDISRGDLLVAAETPAIVARGCKAALVWMDGHTLERNRRYLLKHTSQTVPAVIAAVDYRTDIRSLAHEPAETLEMNGLGVATVQLVRPIPLDRYVDNRITGAFILIDAETNSTVAAGMVTEVLGREMDGVISELPVGAVSAGERAARWGHHGGILALNGPSEWIDRVERSLFVTHAVTIRCLEVRQAEWAAQSGLLALLVTIADGEWLRAEVNGQQIVASSVDPEAGLAALHQLLATSGVMAGAHAVGSSEESERR
ncbi:Sulfate adenylyltransferase subunit 1 [Acidisarcina polymorpha]|uniref:Sulfate adenylyltransferase subunit 1 n=1 Tax=Acidisarcina polymorpha TaxID=2211140 RepID=A0A2Z5G6S6_9BACT|nr:sulfate adenylyltransferase subunit CysN [Acidisarcina polymorpha]AXC14256.1 Sulfate adenylyltransferase subunit 1 [Acidisarcina polymorpha]